MNVNDKIKYIDQFNNTCFYSGVLHRLDGPAVITKNKSEYWYKQGQLHRDGDKPAIININPRVGYKGNMTCWCKDGLYHREGGPAIIFDNPARKEWYCRGKLHREDGPAVEQPSGNQFWIHGEQVECLPTKQEKLVE